MFHTISMVSLYSFSLHLLGGNPRIFPTRKSAPANTGALFLCIVRFFRLMMCGLRGTTGTGGISGWTTAGTGRTISSAKGFTVLFIPHYFSHHQDYHDGNEYAYCTGTKNCWQHRLHPPFNTRPLNLRYTSAWEDNLYFLLVGRTNIKIMNNATRIAKVVKIGSYLPKANRLPNW